jgi:hypothetical protein
MEAEQRDVLGVEQWTDQAARSPARHVARQARRTVYHDGVGLRWVREQVGVVRNRDLDYVVRPQPLVDIDR